MPPAESPSPRLSAYDYPLPDERIARYPVSPRDASRLLVYEKGTISHHTFRQLPGQLPADSLLVFNDTKVIPARAYFQKPTGATIELLLLHPELPTRLVNNAMLVDRECAWACLIGNKKRWKREEVLLRTLRIRDRDVMLAASYSLYDENHVRFAWEEGIPFLEVIQALGEIPLPPYLNRDSEADDRQNYQTVYARQEGAVAAPTAGLHFTGRVLDDLGARGIDRVFLTLHVGAGTFLPVKVEDIREHPMHAEQVVYTRELIERLLRQTGPVVAVGTTSMRSLESLYWLGVRFLRDESIHAWTKREETKRFSIGKLYPYAFAREDLPTVAESLRATLEFMDKGNRPDLTGETELFILPGYPFQLCQGLITNYHQPASTLVMLVAAFVGDDWRKIYDEALARDYRFLSYGDSSLLWGTSAG